MIYEALIDKQHPGYLDGHEDGIVDAIKTWWNEPILSREKARLVAEKWLCSKLELIDKQNQELSK
jgi:hypothetical protein